MKRLKLFIAAMGVAIFGALALVPATSVAALDPLQDVCSANPDSAVCQNRDAGAQSLIGTIVNTLLFLTGTLSVIMIVVAGVLYVISSGDPSKVTRAKNTLTYAIVGLLVAVMAYAIVNWVFKLF